MKNAKGNRRKNTQKNTMTKVLLVIAVVAVLATAGLWIAARKYLKPTEPPAPTQEPTSAPTADDVTEAPETQPLETAEPSEAEETAPDVTEAPTEPAQTQPTEAPVNNPKPTTPPAQKPEETYLKLPYSIPGTSLVIQKVDSYDGIFLEDGSDSDVEGIYAMVLKNTGDVGVEYANITLIQNGRELKFQATALPAGAMMLVQEASAAAYESGKYTECTCDIALLEEFEMSEDMVSVVEADGKLVVTNLTDKTIPCIRIFYKFYMSDVNAYVGGITYTAKVTELAGGASCEISPSHYAAGSSALVMVRTYDTAD